MIYIQIDGFFNSMSLPFVANQLDLKVILVFVIDPLCNILLLLYLLKNIVLQ